MIIFVLIVLIGLMALHEFGHFILAKRFGVKVEEFGIGYPPRLIGKKFGETLYSLNILPFGAFVRIEGEEGGVEGSRSFASKPIWQRALIVSGGVASFWIISIILFSIVMSLGVPTVVDDGMAVNDPRVQVVAVAAGSPAEQAGLQIGDTIKSFSSINIERVGQVQELSKDYKGKEVILTIKRGSHVFDVSLMSRESHPAEQGPMGVGLVRTSIQSYPWYLSVIKGLEATWNTTVGIIAGFIKIGKSLIGNQSLPSGVQVLGPIGVVSLMNQAANLGLAYFIQFIAIISIYLAIFNILPIPALDGGKLVFLLIEKIRNKPLEVKLEQKITAFFFFALISLVVLATIKDISRIF